MTYYELEYQKGYEAGQSSCILSGYNAAQISNLVTPKNWSEARVNGFYDAVAAYCKSLKG